MMDVPGFDQQAGPAASTRRGCHAFVSPHVGGAQPRTPGIRRVLTRAKRLRSGECYGELSLLYNTSQPQRKAKEWRKKPCQDLGLLCFLRNKSEVVGSWSHDHFAFAQTMYYVLYIFLD